MTKLNTNDDLPLTGECPMCVQEHFLCYTWALGTAWKCSQKVVDFFHASWRIVVATAWYSLTLCESRVVPEQTSAQTANCQVFRKIISHESDETCSHSDIQLLSLERNKRASTSGLCEILLQPPPQVAFIWRLLWFPDWTDDILS